VDAERHSDTASDGDGDARASDARSSSARDAEADLPSTLRVRARRREAHADEEAGRVLRGEHADSGSGRFELKDDSAARADRLRAHFREAFRSEPSEALRQWFRAQEELRRGKEDELSAALSEDLWEDLPALSFDSEEARARFFHNVAVFFGSPGPAADLGRARAGFAVALTHFAIDREDGWRARALHNLATAIGNLASSATELEESVRIFDEALEWRTRDREIARAVTLHNRGLAFARLAELDPSRAREHLEAGAKGLAEAVEIRARLGLAEGLAASRKVLEEIEFRLSRDRRD